MSPTAFLIALAHSTVSEHSVTDRGADKIFKITDYGGVGDGVHNNGRAIRQAVAAIGAAGGGTLLLPKGKWLTAPFNMTSHMTL